ncbi:hypothetical protein [Cyanobium sp. ATX-6F1]|uniref:hypothetical protein n=1 Tax=Cyanobium sp. ATX-6F1 TaxID=3137388 RepID=UPI0039BE337C
MLVRDRPAAFGPGETTAAKAAFERALALQEAQDPGNTTLFRRALEGVEARAQRAERQAAALSLWPDGPPPGLDGPLAPLQELALATEQFRLFLDGLEGQPGG